SDIGHDVLGKGEDQSKLTASASSYVSKGFTRGKTDKLMLVSGGAEKTGGAVVTALAGKGATAGATLGATALKPEPAYVPDEDEAEDVDLSALGFAKPSATPAAAKAGAGMTAADKRAEARMKGYEGEACPECANFTLVRNGTCLKCDTCGATTGCS
ncbi:MAG: vitamin B12-dependent ribonucleotide reductase, partial [Salinarimonadaceae bacterium]